ncbi:geranylgeranylglyceryl/heptaprenylglyceryl phosphate synthase [Methanotrichaceae archaeon M04Ac]|jgi:phosphoglycerol geranylgeranyltransferase|uniref:Geranylgeranylglyceryl phosphate synthase n=1 Tax=Candidatus Methanocrinis alkalitolerans TaxID=3033395 RepID=A0ABT5XC72_9EURY|nr:geranylgeranylglyceryl/heptaprenylglyceryl phosphate synthase [Candidatus Methanocrinis alkalitolerans]MCR3884493.1 geranylgeranylglyceryl/heptaprenylglyceryl phosphate synthase [Methanothrix sp.]MDF0592313.1 geranylgeranylglyceryl/heptaprenylglyceryl phosphate synthase [Candidatus Methanocrinis alkalitolerans]
MIGPVEEMLARVAKADGAAHLTLIDPDSQSSAEAGRMAEAAAIGGTDAIMVGGSVGAAGRALEDTVGAIKEGSGLPVVLFPSGVSGLCSNADAVFFMSLLNSRSASYLIENQALGAPLVRRYRIEPIPMAYVVVEPGGTVGWVGDAKLIPRDKPEIAAAYALAGKYFGMRFVYLEAGSGAREPVPAKMVAAVKRAIADPLLIVGGGIRSGEAARERVDAGADIIVTGTGVERSQDVAAFVRDITTAIKGSR